MSHQKQTSNGGSTFASYEVKEEGDYPLRSYQHELEAHMVAPGTVIAEGSHPTTNYFSFADSNRMSTRQLLAHSHPTTE